jgi:pimeloyl-ACP methyl ester carboxylesterase
MFDLVLPRPGAASTSTPPIPAPTEEAFTTTFGKLLPPARYLKTRSGRAAYYEIPPAASGGASDGASPVPDRVLLLHGVQTPALGLNSLARALQTTFSQAHLVLVDLWGHGLSETPVEPHEQRLFHQLIDDLLDHLQWPSVHLVGYSFGAMLSAGYTASRTAKVISLTIIAPAGLIMSADFTDEQRGYLRGGDEPAARKWVLEFLEGGELVVPADWKDRVAKGEIVADAVKEWQMREHAGHFASVVAMFRDGGALDNADVFAQAAASGVPSTVILGELDSLSSKEELNQLGFKHVHAVHQAGHSVVRDQAADVAAVIARFWKGL